MPVDELFSLFADLDVLATDADLAERVARNLTVLATKLSLDAGGKTHEAKGERRSVAQRLGRLAQQKKPATTVAQKRRLAVLQTRLAEVTGRAVTVLPTASLVYEHIKGRAERNKPHGLEAHELGVAHWTIPGVPIRVPFLSDMPTLGAWMLRELAPSVADVRDAAAAPFTAMHYKADEKPGVGFALYTLLPLLDHASAMRKASDAYAAVHGATLRAIRRLLTE